MLVANVFSPCCGHSIVFPKVPENELSNNHYSKIMKCPNCKTTLFIAIKHETYGWGITIETSYHLDVWVENEKI